MHKRNSCLKKCLLRIKRKRYPVLAFAVITSFFAVNVNADSLLRGFGNEILEEMRRAHGEQIRDSAVLTWCGLNEAADDIGLHGASLDRAIYDSVVVSGTQNIPGIRHVRAMNDEEWIEYRSLLYMGLDEYTQGIKEGLSLFIKNKPEFCGSSETEIYARYRVISKN